MGWTTEQGVSLPPATEVGGRSEEVVTMTVPKLLIGAVALSAVAAFVPAALGAERPDDRSGPIGVGAVETTVPWVPYGTADTIEARIKAGLDAKTGVPVSQRPDDRAGPLGVGAVSPTVVETPVASTGNDWTDPLVIAGLAALAAAAAVAVAYGVVHHRHGGAGRTGGPGRTAVTH
jgi:hypothetical protein